jgi:hypothetical protein
VVARDEHLRVLVAERERRDWCSVIPSPPVPAVARAAAIVLVFSFSSASM